MPLIKQLYMSMSSGHILEHLWKTLHPVEMKSGLQTVLLLSSLSSAIPNSTILPFLMRRKMKHLRMRMRVLRDLHPSCPDWRKGRVKDSSEGEYPLTQREMEEFALEKLKIQRQQTLSQRHVEVTRLQEELMGGSSETATNGSNQRNGFVPAPPPPPQQQQFGDLYQPWKAFETGDSKLRKAISLENLIEFGLDVVGSPSKAPGTHQHGPHHPSHPEKRMEAGRRRRLEEIRQELEDIKAIHLHGNDRFDVSSPPLGNNTNNTQKLLKGSTLSLISSDFAGGFVGEEKDEILVVMQRRREDELRRLHQHNLALKYQLGQLQKNSASE